MISKSKSIQVMKDLFMEQLKWGRWCILATIIIHVLMAVFATNADGSIYNLIEFSYSITSFYMLVIGIVAGFIFLPFYVKQGVTRKEYYVGSTISTILLSVTLAALFGILSIIENYIFNIFNYKFNSGGIIASANGSMLLTLVLFSLNIFTYYLIGWLINVGFYRYKNLLGVGFVILAICLLFLHGFLWINGFFSILDQGFSNIFAANPVSLSTAGTVLLIGVILWIIRLVTKNIAVTI